MGGEAPELSEERNPLPSGISETLSRSQDSYWALRD